MMDRVEIYDRLNEIFQDVFDDEEIMVDDTTTADDVEGWDSNMHITLIAEVEDSFGIRFEMRDVVKMRNVGEMVNKIMELTERSK